MTDQIDFTAWEKRYQQRQALAAQIMSLAGQLADMTYSQDYLSQCQAESDKAALGLGEAFHLQEGIGLDGEQAARFFCTSLATSLEGANWHTECQQVAGWIDGMESGKNFHQVINGK